MKCIILIDGIIVGLVDWIIIFDLIIGLNRVLVLNGANSVGYAFVVLDDLFFIIHIFTLYEYFTYWLNLTDLLCIFNLVYCVFTT